jgi:hypothetical protein
LPVENVETFIRALKSTGVTRFIVQPFHVRRGKFIAGTRQAALELLQHYDWSPSTYSAIEAKLREAFPSIGIGKGGFKPV